MEVREGDRTTLIHRLAVLAIGLYSHTQITCPTKGICRNEPSDFASALTILALSNAIGSKTHWPESLLRKPHPILVLIYELILTVVLSEGFMMLVWDPLQKHWGIIGEIFLQVGLTNFGSYLKSNDGIEQLKLFVAALMIYLELIYYEADWFRGPERNEWALASIDDSQGAAGEFFQYTGEPTETNETYEDE